jgi:hypothetical protein
MKKWIMLTIFLIAIALLVISCEVEPADENATIRFSIANDRARTISSDTAAIAIAKYRFILKRGTTSGSEENYETVTKSYSFEFDKSDDGTYQINNILPGPYTIYCEALTSSDVVIGASDTIQTSLRRGESSFSLLISALSGSQKAVLTYTWDTATYVEAPAFVFSVTDEKGKAVTLDSSNHKITETTGKAVVTLTLPAGSYLVKASLNDKKATTVSYACLSDVVRFTNSTTDITSEEMSFGVLGTVQSKATITTNVSTPVIATLSVTPSANKFVAGLTFTGLPDGLAAKDINVDWLIDGELWGSNTGDAGYTMTGIPAGTYRITCVMKCSSLAGSMGSVSQVVTIPGK